MSEKPTRVLPGSWAILLMTLTVVLILLSGWRREMAARYPVSDLPWVDMVRLGEQVRSGNVGKDEAIFYRKVHAGADTTEIR